MPALTRAQRQRYDVLYQSCLIRPARRAAVDQAARRISANRRRYQKVGKALGVPWYVVGIVHSLEASCDFTRHLHNGDPLTARTTHVPAGRPKTGRPPFSWEASAIDALTLQGFGTWKDWSVPGTLYKLEAYGVDGEYGELTAGAVQRAKWELGWPATAGSSTFGPRLQAILSGRQPLPPAFKARRAKRLRIARSEQAVRKRIVDWALWAVRTPLGSRTRRTAASASARSA